MACSGHVEYGDAADDVNGSVSMERTPSSFVRKITPKKKNACCTPKPKASSESFLSYRGVLDNASELQITHPEEDSSTPANFHATTQNERKSHYFSWQAPLYLVMPFVQPPLEHEKRQNTTPTCTWKTCSSTTLSPLRLATVTLSTWADITSDGPWTARRRKNRS